VDLVKALFDSVGKTVVVEEKLINAVTGVRYNVTSLGDIWDGSCLFLSSFLVVVP
jgi:hypothetical protein